MIDKTALRGAGWCPIMKSDPLDNLLEKLCSGDAVAAEKVFLSYEPYLRMVVRRLLPSQLQAKFDSIDVVQSVWADVLSGFRDAGWRFQDANHLRAFLIKATRNRFIDRVRQHRNATERQDSAILIDELMESGQPRPSELVAADELWQRILDLCPPQHHCLVKLKRQGCTLAEIASQTGLHESSVRRILYDLARDLDGHGPAAPDQPSS